MPTCEQIRVAEQALARQLDWIKSIESKLAVIVAVGVAMLGVLASRIPTEPCNWLLVGLFVFLGSGAILAGLVFCAMALCPRVKSPNLSVLFFGSIAAHSAEEYTKRFRQLSEEEYLGDILKQVHRNAEIASVKFGHVKTATFCLLGGIIPWLFALYIMEIL